jgi:hypothetical protein
MGLNGCELIQVGCRGNALRSTHLLAALCLTQPPLSRASKITRPMRLELYIVQPAASVRDLGTSR